MATCLTTILKDSSIDSSLKKNGELRLHIVQKDNAPILHRCIYIVSTVAQQLSIINATGGGSFVDASDTSIGTTLSIDANTRTTVYFSNAGEYDVVIPNKYAIRVLETPNLEDTQFSGFFNIEVNDIIYLNAASIIVNCFNIIGESTHSNLSSLEYFGVKNCISENMLDVAFLNNCNSLKSCNFTGSSLVGNINVFSNKSFLQGFYGGSSNLIGDIVAFSGKPSLNELFLGAQVESDNIVGDIASLGLDTSLQNLAIQNQKNISGNISVLSNLTNLISLDFGNTSVEGNISVLSSLSDLEVLYLYNNNITGDISSLSELTSLAIVHFDGSHGIYGDISAFQDLENLTDVNLSLVFNVTGDVSNFVNCPDLKFLNIGKTKIYGDISVFSNMSNLQTLYATSTKLSGDIADLEQSDLQSLEFLDISFTNVSGDIGVGLSSCSSLKEISVQGCTHLSGDLSILGESVVNVWGDASTGSMTWENTRPSTKSIISLYNISLGNYVDAMLINQANCTKLSGGTIGNSVIRVFGARTTASNQAVKTLNNKGYTVFVNNAPVIV